MKPKTEAIASFSARLSSTLTVRCRPSFSKPRRLLPSKSVSSSGSRRSWNGNIRQRQTVYEVHSNLRPKASLQAQRVRWRCRDQRRMRTREAHGKLRLASSLHLLECGVVLLYDDLPDDDVEEDERLSDSERAGCPAMGVLRWEPRKRRHCRRWTRWSGSSWR